ncbi:histidine phosphatase family protein [Candidatus Woesebacteria bacterium]|nr:histidine phosphatase family protein [Candidatus Woesebacteria bacterium]MCD8507541.1 histidine phosphatase family protein [Candidatus Woesebacteria bacterium]MCD8527382.1 histidine phosphatase family protein [Candidatus Woesebacteria bacterium]MCD8546129.1 histidine phosphatase family protein [Candidatus Woesebacteria bacterium]
MNKTFYLIRHGDKVKTIGDPPLSEKGVAQAIATAEYMSNHPLQQIIASPILRTQQTAKYLADKTGFRIETEPLLRERVNWGDDPEQSFEDFLAMWEKASLERDWTPPVGDSSRNAGKRIQQVIETHDGTQEHIALITHGGVITDFVLNVFDSKTLDEALPDFSKTKDSNVFECSLTIIEYNSTNSNYALKLLAGTDHLTHL